MGKPTIKLEKPLIKITIEGEPGSGKAYVADAVQKALNEELNLFKAKMVDKTNDPLLEINNPDGECKIHIVVEYPKPVVQTGFVPITTVHELLKDAWEMGSAYGDPKLLPDANEAYEQWLKQIFE